MSGSAERRMRRSGQAIMIAWRTSCRSGGSAPRRQSLPSVAPSRGDPPHKGGFAQHDPLSTESSL